MKIIKPFSAIASLSFLLLPTVVTAHPGHNHEEAAAASHLLQVADPYLLSIGLIIFVFSAVWLVKRI